MNSWSHPVLDCVEAGAWEHGVLGSEEAVWAAMTRVGEQLGKAIRAEFSITRFSQSGLRVLGLIGKGHNGGDALLAIAELARIEGFVGAVTLVLASPLSAMKPHTKRAYDLLADVVDIRVVESSNWDAWETVLGERFDLCLDGLLGMQFRPPLGEGLAALLAAVNASRNFRLRVAVDMPTGLGESEDVDTFKADVTFATGIFKRPLLTSPAAGKLRYLDVGFFEKESSVSVRVIDDRILDALRTLRPAQSEKRKFGHLVVVAGSRGMPGALSMCVQSALQSGVGLVTVFAPESVVSQLACRLPEAMWRTWPETPEGGLALEGLWQIKGILGKATCLLLGPGMGSEAETQVLLREIGGVWDKPAVLDADALRPEVVGAFLKSGNNQLILTPHDGEFARLVSADDCSDNAVLAYAKEQGVCLVKKGMATRVSDGESLIVNTTGNAVLSRGGSGDLLAGLIAGLLAQSGEDRLEVACRGVYWHGKAADLLAIAKGQTAVRTTDLLDFLSPALHAGEVWNSNSPASKPFGL